MQHKQTHQLRVINVDNALSFLHTTPGRNPPEVQTLLGYKSTIINMYHLFSFNTDLRTIKKNDIDMFERDLREIVGGIERLRNNHHIDRYLNSTIGLQEKIKQAIRCLYRASDILEQKSTVSSRKMFYELLGECEQYLLAAINQFAI
jgi:t-SNARE complex subunit (syntaxin)